MFYFLYGKNTISSRKKLHELLDFAKKKRPDAEVFRLTTENWTESQLDELISSQGLFSQKYTVILDKLFERKDIKDFILEKIKEMAESEQLFFILETIIDSSSLKKIEEHAKQAQEFKEKEERIEEKSIFSITQGLLERDKKKLWLSYLDFINKGVAPEEINGVFFWQIKNMILAAKGGSQSDTGLSPYVYKNALSGTRKYKTEELLGMSQDLVDMMYRARRGLGEFEIMLEKWILKN